jgi:hypothetical protein
VGRGRHSLRWRIQTHDALTPIGTARPPAGGAPHSGPVGLLSFVLAEYVGMEAVRAMLDGMNLFAMGASWGGYESLIIPFDPRPVRTRHPLAPARPLHPPALRPRRPRRPDRRPRSRLRPPQRRSIGGVDWSLSLVSPPRCQLLPRCSPQLRFGRRTMTPFTEDPVSIRTASHDNTRQTAQVTVPDGIIVPIFSVSRPRYTVSKLVPHI